MFGKNLLCQRDRLAEDANGLIGFFLADQGVSQVAQPAGEIVASLPVAGARLQSGPVQRDGTASVLFALVVAIPLGTELRNLIQRSGQGGAVVRVFGVLGDSASCSFRALR